MKINYFDRLQPKTINKQPLNTISKVNLGTPLISFYGNGALSIAEQEAYKLQDQKFQETCKNLPKVLKLLFPGRGDNVKMNEAKAFFSSNPLVKENPLLFDIAQQILNQQGLAEEYLKYEKDILSAFKALSNANHAVIQEFAENLSTIPHDKLRDQLFEIYINKPDNSYEPMIIKALPSVTDLNLKAKSIVGLIKSDSDKQILEKVDLIQSISDKQLQKEIISHLLDKIKPDPNLIASLTDDTAKFNFIKDNCIVNLVNSSSTEEITGKIDLIPSISDKKLQKELISHLFNKAKSDSDLMLNCIKLIPLLSDNKTKLKFLSKTSNYLKKAVYLENKESIIKATLSISDVNLRDEHIITTVKSQISNDNSDITDLNFDLIALITDKQKQKNLILYYLDKQKSLFEFAPCLFSKLVPLLSDDTTKINLLNQIFLKIQNKNSLFLDEIEPITKAILAISDDPKYHQIKINFLKDLIKDRSIYAKGKHITEAIAATNNDLLKVDSVKVFANGFDYNRGPNGISKIISSIFNDEMKINLIKALLIDEKRYIREEAAQAISSIKDKEIRDSLILETLEFYNKGKDAYVSSGAISCLHCLSDIKQRDKLIEQYINNETNGPAAVFKTLSDIKDKELLNKIFPMLIQKKDLLGMYQSEIFESLHLLSDDSLKLNFSKQYLANRNGLASDLEPCKKIILSMQDKILKDDFINCFLTETNGFITTQFIEYLSTDELKAKAIRTVIREAGINLKLKAFDIISSVSDPKLQDDLFKEALQTLHTYSNGQFSNERIGKYSAYKITENLLSSFYLNIFNEALKKAKVEDILDTPKALSAFSTLVFSGKNAGDFCQIIKDYKQIKDYIKQNIENLIPLEENVSINQIKQATCLKDIPEIKDILSEMQMENDKDLMFDLIQTLSRLDVTENMLPEELTSMSVDELNNTLSIPFSEEDKQKMIQKRYQKTIDYIFKKIEEDSLEIVNSIILTGKGVVLDALNNKSNKFNNFLDAFKLISGKENLLEPISNACKLSGINSYNATKLMEIADGFCKVGKEDIFRNLLDEMNKTKHLDLEKLSKTFFELIAQECGMTSEEIKAIPPEKYNLWDLKNLPLISIALKNFPQQNEEWLKDLFKATIKGNYWEYINDPNTVAGQANIKTKETFKANGLNYENWLNYDGTKDFLYAVTNSNEQFRTILDNFLSDLNVLLENPAIKDELNNYINNLGYKLTDGKLISQDGNELSIDTAPKVIKGINEFMTKYWQVAKDRNNQALLTIQDHFKQRLKDIEELRRSSAKSQDLKIERWKRQPGHDLFQGTYCQCCVALDGGNGQQAPEALVNTAIQVAEIKETEPSIDKNQPDQAQTKGQVDMYFAKNLKTGETILVANGVEMAVGYQQSKTVRDAIAEYMRNYSKSVTGKDNIPLYIGKNYQDVPLNDLSDEKLNIQVIGNFTNNTFYFDSITPGVWTEELDKPKTVELLRLDT